MVNYCVRAKSLQIVEVQTGSPVKQGQSWDCLLSTMRNLLLWKFQICQFNSYIGSILFVSYEKLHCQCSQQLALDLLKATEAIYWVVGLTVKQQLRSRISRLLHRRKTGIVWTSHCPDEPCQQPWEHNRSSSGRAMRNAVNRMCRPRVPRLKSAWARNVLQQSEDESIFEMPLLCRPVAKRKSVNQIYIYSMNKHSFSRSCGLIQPYKETWAAPKTSMKRFNRGVDLGYFGESKTLKKTRPRKVAKANLFRERSAKAYNDRGIPGTWHI